MLPEQLESIGSEYFDSLAIFWLFSNQKGRFWRLFDRTTEVLIQKL